MNIIVCLDDNGGMLFNHRRQSQDRILRERIMQLTAGCKLYMNGYSQQQFQSDSSADVCVSEHFLDDASSGDYCFVEDQPLLPYLPQVEKIIVYRWNRTYPYDMKFDLHLEDWSLVASDEFVGSSHDRITEEVYVR